MKKRRNEKKKFLLSVTERTKLALIKAGWKLVSEIIWVKQQSAPIASGRDSLYTNLMRIAK
jgi:DNA modification methylase